MAERIYTVTCTGNHFHCLDCNLLCTLVLPYMRCYYIEKQGIIVRLRFLVYFRFSLVNVMKVL